MAGADPGVSTIPEPDHEPSSPSHDRGHAGPQPVVLYPAQLPVRHRPPRPPLRGVAGRSGAGGAANVPDPPGRAADLLLLLQHDRRGPAVSVHRDAGAGLGGSQAALPEAGAAAAGRAQPRGDPPLSGRRPGPQDAHRAGHRLCRRAARLRGRGATPRRHRQPAHGPARGPGQGPQGAPGHALAPAARAAARLLEDRAAIGRVAVSRPGNRPAHQHPRSPARLPDGAGGGRDRQARDPAYPAAQLRHPSARGRHGPVHDPAAARPPQPVDHGALPACRHQHGLRRRQSARPPGLAPAAGLNPGVARTELEVADIIRHHGAAYRQSHAGTLNRAQLRVLRALEICRTATLGGHIDACDACGHTRISYNSCRNRHCPKCQAPARAEWLEARQADLLPVPYFHVVFTLPEPVAAIAFQNQRVVYDILFRTAAATLKTIAADPRHLGAEIGFIAVLHTWGQTLQYHPHLHCVVPGGGLAPDGEGWIACRPGFFLPVRVLSSLFRRLFLEALDAAFRAGELGFHVSLGELASPPGSPGSSTTPVASRGWSTPSRRSAVWSRCSSISAATPTGSPFPTTGWSGSRAAASPSAGRTTGIMTARR